MTQNNAQPLFTPKIDACIVTRYTSSLIKGFRHKGVERFSLKGTKAGIWAVWMSGNWRLIHGQSGISADMARRLEAWLGGPKHGPSAESWLKMQVNYDLWQAMQRPAPKVVKAMKTRSKVCPTPRDRVSDHTRRAAVLTARRVAAEP